jgi:hypothetical protein
MKAAGVVLCVLAAVGTPSLALAGGEEIPATEFVHEDAAGKLDILGEVAVVIAGNDPFINRIMEDVLAINLMSRGIKLAYPEQADFGKPRREADTDPMQVAQSVGANGLVTGMVVTEPPGEWQFRTVRVSIASLSLIDVPQDKSLVWVLYEPEQPVTSTRIASAFAEFMVESLE